MPSAVVSWRIDAPPPWLVLFSYPVVCVWLYAWGPREPPPAILSTRIFLQQLLLMLLLPVEYHLQRCCAGWPGWGGLSMSIKSPSEYYSVATSTTGNPLPSQHSRGIMKPESPGHAPHNRCGR